MNERERKPSKSDDGIDYRAEGGDPGSDSPSPTDRGYDEAAHSGPSRYGIPEGEGGVFGTSGGGSYGGGMQVVERPGLYDRGGEEPESREAHHPRETDRFDRATLEGDDTRRTRPAASGDAEPGDRSS